MKITQELILQVEKAEREVAELRKAIADQIRAGAAEGAQRSEAEIARLTDNVIKEMDRAKRAAEEMSRKSAASAGKLLEEAARLDAKAAAETERAWQRTVEAAKKADAQIARELEAATKGPSPIEKWVNFDNFMKGIDGAKKAIEVMGSSLFGLTEQGTKTASTILDTAKAGGELGNAFGGPLVGAILSVAGALGGAFAAKSAQAKAELKSFRDQAKQSESAVKDLRASTNDLGTMDLSKTIAALKELDKTRTAALSAKTTAEDPIARLKFHLEKQIELTKEQQNFEAIGTTALDSVTLRTEALGKELGKTTKHLASLGQKASLKELKSEFDAARKKAAASEKEIEDLTKSIEAARKIGNTKVYEELIKQLGGVETRARAANAELGAADAALAAKRQEAREKDAAGLERIQEDINEVGAATLVANKAIADLFGGTQIGTLVPAATYEDILKLAEGARGAGEEIDLLGDLAKGTSADFQLMLDPTPWGETSLALFGLREGLTDIKKTAKDVGLELRDSLGDIGSGAAMALFDALEEGQPILRALGGAFRDLASDALKGIGSELVGQGALDAAKGAGLLIRSAGLDPRGWALEAHGAAEIAGGLALGGAGALAGRIGKGGGGRGGRGRDFESEAGGSGGGTLFGGAFTPGFNGPRDPGPSTTNNATTIINVQTLDPGDRETWERVGRIVERGRSALHRAGGRLFDGRR